ncbi:hypothetical protein LTS08_006129 [Lithohypha guttulata]|nr:hypothetical protein LTS08_006129 [Lithohypha guttulata]
MGKTPIAVPLVDLHLAYYGFIIMAQGILLGSASTADPEFSCAKDKIINASNHVASLFQMLQHITSQGNFGVYFAHISAISALILVQFLTEPGVPDIFHILTVVLVCVSRRWVIVRGILRMIWATLTRHKVEWYLNAATSSLFHLAALEEWGPREHQLLKKCAYPNYAEVHEKGRDYVEMGDILQEYASMQISGSTEVDPSISRS